MLEKPTRQDDMRGQTTESEDGQQHHDQAPDDDAFERAASSSPSSTAEDLPNRLQQPRGPAGYAHLAEFMTKTQHSMVRRYQELSLQNLLYLQAEIHMLKTDLDKETAADSRAPGECERSVWDYHWWSLATSPARGIGEGRRWDLWTRLRGRLGEYCASSLVSLFVLLGPRSTSVSGLVPCSFGLRTLTQFTILLVPQSLATQHPQCPSPAPNYTVALVLLQKAR